MTVPSLEKQRPILTPSAMLLRATLGVVVWVLVSLVLVSRAIPQQHLLSVGDIADETIKATRDVEDTVTTEQKREEARRSVPDVYRLDEMITANALQSMQNCFESMNEVRALATAERSAWQQQYVGAEEKPEFAYTDAFIHQCVAKLGDAFTDESVRILIDMPEETLNDLRAVLTDLMEKTLAQGVKQEMLATHVNSFSQQLSAAAQGFDAQAQRLGMNVVSAFLTANYTKDDGATEAARQSAMNAVEPVSYKKGQNIVREGDPVNEAQLAMLKDLGLLEDTGSSILMIVGAVLFVGVALLFVWLYALLYEPKVYASLRRMLILGAMIVLCTVATWLCRQVNTFFLPTAMCAILLCVLVGDRVALIANAAMAILVGLLDSSFMSAMTMPVVAASLVGGYLAVYVIRQAPQRTTLLLAGIVAGVSSATVVAAAHMIIGSPVNTVLSDVGFMLSGALFASMLCLGLLPLLEMVFHVVTPMKLLELSNPNHPLLKRLLLEAPGTYHHSIIVGNLAESAAEAIGANPLLTRTAAYYHDVGKLLRPYFFKENQTGPENPHDSIEPELSKRIIVGHTREGYELARKYGIPLQILEIIQSHHGTTPILYFYMKAVRQAPQGEQIPIDSYRYPGPKPNTREAALIMLADSVEAASRSLTEHTPEKLGDLVQRIVDGKLEDGQLSECDITLRDLGIISAEFRKVLGGIYHERIEYPQVEYNVQEEPIDSEW